MPAIKGFWRCQRSRAWPAPTRAAPETMPLGSYVKKGVGYKPNSVPLDGAMIIYLGCRSPGTSCNLPESFGRAALKRFPIWSYSGWGLPCLSCRHESGELLPRRFTLTPENRGGLFSVALSRGRPRFALRTIPPCGVRTFLTGGLRRRDHAPTPKLSSIP